MRSALLSNVERVVVLTDSARAKLSAAFAPLECLPGEQLVRSGAASRYAYFLTAGALRTYFLDAEGTERTIELSFEGDWAGDINAFTSGKPTTLHLEALEATEVLRISYFDLERLLADVPQLEKYFRTLYSYAYASYTARLCQFIGTTATQRYTQFCERRAAVLHRVPQKIIASYIGVTPESLSRIRRGLNG